MNPKTRQTIFYITAFGVMSFLAFLILQPFIIALALSAMFAVILQPVYHWLKRNVKSENVAAILTVLFLMVVIVLPVALTGNKIIVEAQSLYTKISAGNLVSVDYLNTHFETFVRKYIPGFSFNPNLYVEAFSGWLIARLGGFFSGTLTFFVKFLLSLVALFYFLRDGEIFKKHVIALSPLSDTKDKIITDSLKSAIRSVLLGSVLVGIIQGFLTGLGFAIFGLPNYTLWGTAAAIASFIPGIGTSIVWIPAVIYLFFYGYAGAWIGEILWSVLFVALIDNFLAPIIFNRGVHIHPLFVLFSILGGVELFGPEGFIIGPIVISLLFALIRVVELSEGPTPTQKDAVEKTVSGASLGDFPVNREISHHA